MDLADHLMCPELMIIGDSLAQGCRSLTVDKSLCAQSWAARVAAKQSWSFVTPDFCRYVLFDLYDEIKRLGPFHDVAAIDARFDNAAARMIENIEEWLQDRVESEYVCFDNLGVAGARISDLYTTTSERSNAYIRQLFPHKHFQPFPMSEISNLHLAINSRFVLNPSRSKTYDKLTPIGWVLARKPQRLIVQIGHNHGLYQVGADARYGAIDCSEPDGTPFLRSIRRVATDLAPLASGTNVIWVLLPKISAVAGLDPSSTERHNGYARSYTSVFSLSRSSLSESQVRSIDQQIRRLNVKIRQIVSTAFAGAAIAPHFIDAYRIFRDFDYKNSLDESRKLTAGKYGALDNFYLRQRLLASAGSEIVEADTLAHRVQGGVQSIDGLHPTGPGYAAFARAAVAAAGSHLFPHAIDELVVEESYAEDSLLKETPYNLELLILLLDLLRHVPHPAVLNIQPEGRLVAVKQDFTLREYIELVTGILKR